MLGRTAASLFWMSRYMERAENIARLVEAGHRLALLTGSDADAGDWRSTLASAACLDGYLARHETVAAGTAIDYLLFDPANPVSVRVCLESARDNGRSVRTALTRDMWEALNTTWNEFAAAPVAEVREGRLPEFLDWIRQRAMLFRGALLGTILRNDGYHFSQLGAFVERADQTARILDVKHYALLPEWVPAVGDVDTYTWEAILRAVSAHRSYRHVYEGPYRPGNVAEFLIVREEMPRSLRYSYRWIAASLERLALDYGTAAPVQAEARATLALLEQTDMAGIFSRGLHAFLLDFIARNNALAARIAEDYHFA